MPPNIRRIDGIDHAVIPFRLEVDTDNDNYDFDLEEGSFGQGTILERTDVIYNFLIPIPPPTIYASPEAMSEASTPSSPVCLLLCLLLCLLSIWIYICIDSA